MNMDTLKPIVLSSLIALAAVFGGKAAKAAEAETLIVAGGCFWCVESDFESVDGVIAAVSGYTGGSTDNPTYKQVSRGGSGHYEAVMITFDPAQVSRENLLRLFFRSVDPTDAGGQFCDRGENYRTAIFVSNKGEMALAEQLKTEAQAALGKPVVTPILGTSKFYEAEDYHQDYYKGSNLVFTRFGPKRQSEAYKRYRKACKRDERVRELWGEEAQFASKYLGG